MLWTDRPNRKSETYGYITTTPKLAWKNYNIVGAFADALDIPVGFDTDVNGSALGEATWGITKGLDNSIYITIGTGVGMGIISNGKLLHGMLHPEGGHVLLTRHPKDTYGGKCPYHSNCLEGLAKVLPLKHAGAKKVLSWQTKKRYGELEAYLYRTGTCRLHHAALPAENRFGRRRYASGAYDAARKRRSKETAERISCNKRT